MVPDAWFLRPALFHCKAKPSFVVLSETRSMALNTETLLIIFVAFTGVSVLLQACVLLAIYFSLRKTAKSAMEASEDFKSTVLPMVHSTRQLIDRITPQVISITEGLAELTVTMKKETNGVSFSASEIMERVNRQSQRLDGMLTHGLDAVERAGEVVESAVAGPIRQVNGIVAGIKAAIETYRSGSPQASTAYPSSYPNPDPSTAPIDSEI
jgi:hypothetical protein